MRPVTILLYATMACSGSDPAPAAPEGGEAAEQPASEEPAAAEAEPSPTQVVNGKERAKLSTREGTMTATWTFGGKKHRVTAPIDQVSLRIGNLPTLDYPIGHVKIDVTGVRIEGKDEWNKPFVDEILTSYGTPMQVFFDVSSVADMVGTLDGPGSEAAGAVLGGLQVNESKLETTVPVAFTRLETGLKLEVQPFEVQLEEVGLTKGVEDFATATGAGRPGPTVTIQGTLDVPWYFDDVLPNFVRVPVTINRARDFEQMVDESVSHVDAYRRRLRRMGFSDAYIDSLNLTNEGLEKVEQFKRDNNRSKQIDLEGKQRQIGRNEEGLRR